MEFAYGDFSYISPTKSIDDIDIEEALKRSKYDFQDVSLNGDWNLTCNFTTNSIQELQLPEGGYGRISYNPSQPTENSNEVDVCGEVKSIDTHNICHTPPAITDLNVVSSSVNTSWDQNLIHSQSHNSVSGYQGSIVEPSLELALKSDKYFSPEYQPLSAAMLPAEPASAFDHGLAGSYYNSALYGGQALYSTHPALTQSYNGVRNLKANSAAAAAAYSLNPYLGAAQNHSALQNTGTLGSYYQSAYPGVTGNVGHQSSLDQCMYQYQPYQYYSSNYGTAFAPNGHQTTSATYQLTQLPPSTSSPISTGTGNLLNVSQSYSIKDLSPSEKSEASIVPKKTKKKRKQRDESASPPSQWDRVFLWELEDVLIIYESLVTTAYAHKFGKPANACAQLGSEMTKLINLVGARHFHSNEVTDCDQTHIDDMVNEEASQEYNQYGFQDGFIGSMNGNICLPSPSQHSTMRSGVDWMKKLACRYRKVKDAYQACREGNVQSLFHGTAEQEHYNSIRSQVELFTNSWFVQSTKCLTLINQKPKYANVLVSNDTLSNTLVKLLLYGLAPFFPIENIYSAKKIGKDQVYDRISHRFGPKCVYIVCGNSREDETAAKHKSFPFWRVQTQSDLRAMGHALEQDHL